MKQTVSPGAAFHALISGRVQGVGFRYTCYHEAGRLGLSGWVRNCPDGDVEIRAEGDREKLEAFLQWLQRGPPGARVDTVKYDMVRAAGTYKAFAIER
ncbi:MAG: acylphosphatase [Treponema sp.]|jgi:acylphosphatase|nr:acylphosphatase [Treponema sp.]